MLNPHIHTQKDVTHSHLHSLDDVVDVPQQVLSQHQPQSGFTLHWLVHINVHIYRTIGLNNKKKYVAIREQRDTSEMF